MKKLLLVLSAVFAFSFLAKAQLMNTRDGSTLYGFAYMSVNHENWEHEFIKFNSTSSNMVQGFSEHQDARVLAAEYVGDYVWFIAHFENSDFISLCRAYYNSYYNNGEGVIMSFETLVEEFGEYGNDHYVYVKDMSYNPVDGKLYYVSELCYGDYSEYNLYAISLSFPFSQTKIRTFDEMMVSFAINNYGHMYAIGADGNLYMLSSDSMIHIGSTGVDVGYNDYKSMAFDKDSGVLYWAYYYHNYYANVTDHGLYSVNTTTGAATFLGTIGSGAEITGLFVNNQHQPSSQEITEVYIEGFTAPTWGAHPDFDLEVDASVPYSIQNVSWIFYNTDEYFELSSNNVFNRTDGKYYMRFNVIADDGYSFEETIPVFINGDASLIDPGYGGVLSSDCYSVFTIDYSVESNINTYTVNAIVIPSDAGVVNGTGTYPAGSTVTLVAIPTVGYSFLKWSDNVTENPRIFTVNEDVNLLAVFSGMGVEENDAEAIALYPNPTTGMVRIEAEGLKNVEVYDLTGQKVFAEEVSGETFEYDFSGLNGIYFIRIETAQGVETKRLVVK